MTAAPQRLRLSRAKGFNLQEASRALNGLEAVHVARPGKWGSPFNFRRSEYCWLALSYGCRGDAHGRQQASVLAFREWIAAPPGMRNAGMERGVTLGNDKKRGDVGPRLKVGPAPTAEEIRRDLRGKNLACWCAPDAPCHADVLLEIANR